MPENYLEPEFADAYNGWQKQRTPQNATTLLNTVRPAIDKAISAHVGSNANPLLRSQAKSMALQAMTRYDPTRARLGTHLMNQLQGLKRVNRQQAQIISVPERVALEHGHLAESLRTLQDELGREPSDQELADYTGVSPRRLQHLRRYRPPMAEGMLQQQQLGEGGGGAAPSVDFNPSDHWLELVYGELDPRDQLILEHTLGLHGREPLSNQVLAAKLGLSPGAISQRKAKIQQLLDQQDRLSPFGS